MMLLNGVEFLIDIFIKVKHNWTTTMNELG